MDRPEYLWIISSGIRQFGFCGIIRDKETLPIKDIAAVDGIDFLYFPDIFIDASVFFAHINICDVPQGFICSYSYNFVMFIAGSLRFDALTIHLPQASPKRKTPVITAAKSIFVFFSLFFFLIAVFFSHSFVSTSPIYTVRIQFLCLNFL